MRIWLPALLMVVLATQSFAKSVVAIVPGKVYEWDAEKNGYLATYRVGDLTISFQVSRGSDPTRAILAAAQDGGPKTTFSFIGGFDHPATHFFVGHLDPANPTMQVVLGAYSGGAHCCMPKDVFVIWGGKWIHRRIDSAKNSDVLEYPKDLGDDGTLAFALYDDRFAYQFGCFACSWLPPQFFYLKGDKIIDATASGRYDGLLERNLKKAEDACIGKIPLNGLCAGVAADGARLRKFETNWRWMLQHYPRSDNWQYPDGCAVDVLASNQCPADKIIKFKSFPESLAWFLRRNGYITRAQERWATDESREPTYR